MSINQDLRNFAKSSTNLVEQVAEGGNDPHHVRFLEKNRVLFKEEPDESHARIGVDDDVDSVQHLDLSVIGDHQHDYNNNGYQTTS